MNYEPYTVNFLIFRLWTINYEEVWTMNYMSWFTCGAEFTTLSKTAPNSCKIIIILKPFIKSNTTRTSFGIMLYLLPKVLHYYSRHDDNITKLAFVPPYFSWQMIDSKRRLPTIPVLCLTSLRSPPANEKITSKRFKYFLKQKWLRSF